MALGTAALVLAGTFVAAAPAQAVTYGDRGSTRIYFGGSSYNSVDTYKASGLVRGGGTAVSVKFAYKTRYYGSPSKPKKSTMTLQRKVGSGKWKTITKIKPKATSNQTITAEIPGYVVPAGVASQTVQYRVKVKKSGKIVKGDTSTPIKIKYENQAAYTDLAAIAYAAMAAYCPTASVRVDPTLSDRGRAGEFSAQKGISVDDSLATYTPEYQASVALHECAHMKQFYNWGASYKGDKKMTAAATAIYVNDQNPADPASTPPVVGAFDPVEHSADCASFAINPLGYLGYGGFCNQGELDAGVRLMQGSRF
jgi:hypothetical protein